jgi:hypothetical protein
MSLCPVCEEPVEPRAGDYGDKVYVDCPVCGMFGISRSAISMLSGAVEKNPAARMLVSHYVRKTLSNIDPTSLDTPLLTSKLLGAVLDFADIPAPREQANYLILWLGDKLRNSDPGSYVPLTAKQQASIMGAASTNGAAYVGEYLAESRVVHGPRSIDGGGHLGLTFSGWDRYDELQRTHSEGSLAFMAMPFNDALLDHAFASCFRPAVAQCGFTLRRIDERSPAGSIDNRLRVEIRRSRFILVELTNHNAGAYWEAGFAEGLGKPVIYTCQQSHFAKTHFDANHNQTIVWTPDNLDAAAARLKDTIRATLPTEAKMSDN